VRSGLLGCFCIGEDVLVFCELLLELCYLCFDRFECYWASGHDEGGNIRCELTRTGGYLNGATGLCPDIPQPRNMSLVQPSSNLHPISHVSPLSPTEHHANSPIVAPQATGTFRFNHSHEVQDALATITCSRPEQRVRVQLFRATARNK
jgi:hypothetical protein